MTPSDLDEIRKRCEGPGCVECGTPDSAADDVKALLDEVERLQCENEMLTADVDVFDRNYRAACAMLDLADMERNGLTQRLALLEPVWEAAKEWRLACARKDSTPEEVGGLWAVFVAAIDAAVAKEGK